MLGLAVWVCAFFCKIALQCDMSPRTKEKVWIQWTKPRNVIRLLVGDIGVSSCHSQRPQMDQALLMHSSPHPTCGPGYSCAVGQTLHPHPGGRNSEEGYSFHGWVARPHTSPMRKLRCFLNAANCQPTSKCLMPESIPKVKANVPPPSFSLGFCVCSLWLGGRLG